ncbi:MAG: Rossmann-like and DUF2520 domain-containing protein [Gemmatimonadales bacterium]|nr:Rossmann-like and DUF2520 domain-containing protein [Gemmatimonadales bacterium]
MASIPKTVLVGAGRLSRGLGLVLAQRGAPIRFAVRRPTGDLPAPSGPIDDAATYRGVRWFLIGVPDDAIWGVARQLGALGVVGPSSTVLHLSGVYGREVLKPLRLTGAALGSFHPLQSFALPATAPERLPGASVGVEGDPRALRASRRLARLLGLVPVTIPEGAKPAYHAAATIVSSYVVVLYEMAVRLAEDAGINPVAARTMYRPLLAGTVANLGLLPPAHALTGAVRRGDLATIKAHLAALGRSDRALYRELGRRALALARRHHLDPERIAAMADLLADREKR